MVDFGDARTCMPKVREAMMKASYVDERCDDI